MTQIQDGKIMLFESQVPLKNPGAVAQVLTLNIHQMRWRDSGFGAAPPHKKAQWGVFENPGAAAKSSLLLGCKKDDHSRQPPSRQTGRDGLRFCPCRLQAGAQAQPFLLGSQGVQCV